jgi:hypothetical protein
VQPVPGLCCCPAARSAREGHGLVIGLVTGSVNSPPIPLPPGSPGCPLYMRGRGCFRVRWFGQWFGCAVGGKVAEI